MKLKYEGAFLDLLPSDQFHKAILRAIIKKCIGSLIGKPYKLDDFLQVAFSTVANKKNYTLIDVGCNIGTTALPVAACFPNGRVIAIDAHPVALSRIINNIRANQLSNVAVVAAAISDQFLPLRIHSCATNSGGNRVTGFDGRNDLPTVQDNIIVPAMTLDAVMEYFKIDVCDVLKIDVEGYELNVLRSAAKTLTPTRFPLVVLEYGPEGCRSAGTTGWEIVSYMLDRGYKCSNLHNGKAIRSAGDIPNIPDFSVTDFVFDAR